ncbi:antitoxin [Paraburkholderia strydomiana]|nr:antitoxin [Paraburkholderia strydomiana]
MKTTIRRMGNSQGVLIPKPVLAQLGLENEVEMEVENDALVLRRPRHKAREGWAEASKALAEAGDDGLVMGEFGNADDAEFAW